MHVFIQRFPEHHQIVFVPVACGPDEMLGDTRSVLRPGESALGLTYKEWMQSDATEITISQFDPPQFTIDSRD
jgi:hypothetical protein